MFLGINMFWALLRRILEISLTRAQNIFMPANINSIVIINQDWVYDFIRSPLSELSYGIARSLT